MGIGYGSITNLCSTHTNYQARNKPRSTCKKCWKAYRRERQKHDIVASAAERLSKLLNCEVTFDVRYRRKDLIGDGGMQVIVTPINDQA